MATFWESVLTKNCGDLDNVHKQPKNVESNYFKELQENVSDSPKLVSKKH